jgi:hypothetical protein
MQIVLIVAVLVVAVAVLYMTVTLSMRTRQTTAPLIDDAVKGVSGQIDTAAQDLRRQIADGRQQEMEQLRTDGRRIQGHLDHLDERAASNASQVLAALETIRRLVEQLGARQDQLGADLGKLDHQVARLGESLTRPNAARPPAVPPAVPAAVPPPVPNTPAGARPTVPGRLYAERLRFSIVAGQKESLSPRPERRYRIQVERQVGTLPSPQPVALDPSAIIHRADNDAGLRERLSDAASDYFASKLGNPVFAAVTERWITQNAYPETALVEVCNRIGSGLDTVVEKPLEKAGSQLLLPGPEAAAAAGIGATLILQPVAEPLGQAATFLEITGVVVGLATGLHPLALAAAKMLAHDQFHDSMARGLREAARQVFEGPRGPADDPRPLRPVEQAPATDRTPAAPARSTPWEPPPASGPPATQPSPGPVDPGWDAGPTIGGPGVG